MKSSTKTVERKGAELAGARNVATLTSKLITRRIQKNLVLARKLIVLRIEKRLERGRKLIVKQIQENVALIRKLIGQRTERGSVREGKLIVKQNYNSSKGARLPHEHTRIKNMEALSGTQLQLLSPGGGGR